MDHDTAFSRIETERTYDSWSDWFPYIYGSYEEGTEYFYKTIGLTMRKHLAGGRLIDAGCGVGLTSGALLKAGFEVLGIDLSSKSINLCTPLLSQYPGMAEFRTGNLLNLPVDIGNLDGVAATTAILSHFLSEKEQLRFLGEMAKALRPGGIILLSTSDYEKRLEEEPDDFCTQPVLRRDGAGKEFLYFQRRIWKGKPRERVYTSLYYRLRHDQTVDCMRLTMRAITRDEIEDLLRISGLMPVEWLTTHQTGFHKDICIARKQQGIAGLRAAVDGLADGQVSPSA